MVARILVLLMLPALTFAETTHLVLDNDNRSDLHLTVYQGNFAVVKDARQIVLPAGTYELEYKGIARDIDPTSVIVTSSKAGLRIIEQNYRFDVLNKTTLLQNFIGRKLKYSRSVLREATYEKVLREGTLLSIDPEVVQFGDEIEIAPEGIISLPYFPADLMIQPTLVWLLENKLSGQQIVVTSYLTENISWQADHLARLKDDEQSLDLNTWVTITNSSGIAFQDTGLQLVAGDVNRVVAPASVNEMASRAMMAGASAMPEREEFFDYHSYHIPGKTTLRNNELKQLKLMEAVHINVDKTYVMESELLRHQVTETDTRRFDIRLQFLNTARHPIPAGKIRVFRSGADSAAQLVGEDQIRNTPVAGEVSITLGKAFDLTASRTQTEFRRIGDRSLEIAYRIDVQNHKTEPATVQLREKIYGDWRVVSESHESTQVDSSTLLYALDLGKSEQQSVSYSVRLKW